VFWKKKSISHNPNPFINTTAIRVVIQNIPHWCCHLHIRGIVHKEFVPRGQTVNFGFYCEVLWRLHENVRRHRPQIWREQTWLLHHDNAPSHTSIYIHQFLAKNKIAVIPHPQHSLDLSPWNFLQFPNWNWSWKDAGLIPLRRTRLNRRECLTLWQERTCRKRSKNGGDGGNDVYMREGTTSRATAAVRPHDEFYDFYSISPENFGSNPCITSHQFLPNRSCHSFTFLAQMYNHTEYSLY
jgi:hypothetical protein